MSEAICGAERRKTSPGFASLTRATNSIAHHQHRALGVAHHVAGIGAEEIGAHRVALRSMRAHDDEIGADARRLLEDFLIDAALAHGRGDARGREPRLLDDGSTLTSRIVASEGPAIIVAVASAGLASAGSARSTGTRIFLYMAPSLSLLWFSPHIATSAGARQRRTRRCACPGRSAARSAAEWCAADPGPRFLSMGQK